jgi:hypothetical protein
MQTRCYSSSDTRNFTMFVSLKFCNLWNFTKFSIGVSQPSFMWQNHSFKWHNLLQKVTWRWLKVVGPNNRTNILKLHHWRRKRVSYFKVIWLNGIHKILLDEINHWRCTTLDMCCMKCKRQVTCCMFDMLHEMYSDNMHVNDNTQITNVMFYEMQVIYWTLVFSMKCKWQVTCCMKCNSDKIYVNDKWYIEHLVCCMKYK